MKRAALLFFVLTLLFSSSSRAQSADSARTNLRPVQRDSFFGLDKPKHFVLSFFIQSAAFASFEAAGGSRRAAMGGASVLTGAVGVGREIHDLKTKGLFSFSDLFWDALGAGTAAVMLRHTYR